MSASTKIQQDSLPQTYIHLARQFRNPEISTHYFAWNAGKNSTNNGVTGYRSKMPKHRTQLPICTQRPLTVKQANMVDMFLERKLGSLQIICALLWFVSWFLLGSYVVKLLNPF
jgi:hypothetical protein